MISYDLLTTYYRYEVNEHGEKRQPVTAKPEAGDKPTTLKDLLNPEIVNKLKSQADEMKAKEAEQREKNRQEAEDARKAEKKRLESDFGYLLENSGMDWRKHKN
ncbi:YqkE family protein [Paenibacillus sp. RC67]|uniref:YqkE family protein n=1 Tax=Paenibacillus sp. RC67 TaxID=3039392 RepID=UPI0024ADE7A5|nr:YqkE family protein [Paenibacillus sp. RC67]